MRHIDLDFHSYPGPDVSQPRRENSVFRFAMRAKFVGPCMALALLVGAMGISAQSNDNKSPRSIETLKQQAASGNAAAQYDLGISYHNGDGVPQDDAQAASWFRKAADQGNALAQYNLGLLYEDGSGVPQDFGQAVIWYRKAGDQHQANAEYSLGLAYFLGRGVPKDYAQAASLYHDAAEQGVAPAQYNLGVMCAKGIGVPQDYVQAAIWYRKAANQGDANAQFKLGELYARGVGVPRDYGEAYFWMDLPAAAQIEGVDEYDIADERTDAAAHLTPEDLSRILDRSRKWLADHPAEP